MIQSRAVSRLFSGQTNGHILKTNTQLHMQMMIKMVEMRKLGKWTCVDILSRFKAKPVAPWSLRFFVVPTDN